MRNSQLANNFSTLIFLIFDLLFLSLPQHILFGLLLSNCFVKKFILLANCCKNKKEREKLNFKTHFSWAHINSSCIQPTHTYTHKSVDILVTITIFLFRSMKMLFIRVSKIYLYMRRKFHNKKIKLNFFVFTRKIIRR